MRQWRHVFRICLGWLLNLLAFTVMCCVFIAYGCTFRTLSSEAGSDAFVNSWLISIANRFIAMEPIVILVGIAVPMLLSTECCANMFTEGCNNVLGIGCAMCVSFTQQLGNV
eukprot:scaffold100365_cov75-Phaeocystis_antarctica.AAC.3